MKKRRGFLIAVICVAAATAAFAAFRLCSSETKARASDGTVIAVLKIEDGEYITRATDAAYAPFVRIAVDEAIDAYSREENISEREAKEKLYGGGFTISTSLDVRLQKAAEQAVKKRKFPPKENAGVAATDLNGKILIAYGAGEKDVNYALYKTYAGSTIKPLSVYAPAIDAGKIDWSSEFIDEPVSVAVGTDGRIREWPSNADGTYSRLPTTAREGLERSLNTVAVKVLKEFGVEKSLEFLKKSFDMDLDFETEKMKNFGGDEILSNIALGYLYAGVSPLEAAGYYQIFGNGGNYIKPYCVNKIKNGFGITKYAAKPVEKRVIKESTAYITNKLLQETTSENGTAKNAAVNGTEFGAKTGTSKDYKDNWFIGFTPEYCLAIWHGSDIGGVRKEKFAVKIFNEIMTAADVDSSKKFPTSPDVERREYLENGKTRFGYYAKDSSPAQKNQPSERSEG